MKARGRCTLRTRAKLHPLRSSTVLAAIGVTLALAACGGNANATHASTGAGGGSSSSSGSASSAKKTIGVLVPEASNNTYSAEYVRKIQQLASQDNVTLKIYNAGYDVATQSSQASALFAQHPDGLIFWPASPTGARQILLQAKQQNIPVDISNSALSLADAPLSLYHTFTGPSNVQIGVDDANLMNQALGGHGRVAMIEGQPANSTNIDRVNGFKTRLKQVAPGIQIVCDVPGFWVQAKAEAAAAECLSRFSNNINGFYASDDITAAGIVQALKAAGIRKGKVKVVSAGGNALGLPLVKQGWVYGDLFQAPDTDATLAIQNILKVINGQSVPHAIYFPTPAVNAQNVSTFKPQW
jgi:ribose transport system substrate-binding protein